MRTAALLDRLFPQPRDFNVRFWDGFELRAGRPSAFTLILNHPGTLRQMFSPPIELSLGEAFIYGDFDIEGDLYAAFSLMDQITTRRLTFSEFVELARDLFALPKPSTSHRGARGPASLRGMPHSLQRDRAAIQYHYDVGNDFFALWLDRRMQYSCGYFPTGVEDLDTAQERKLEHICRKLRLHPGERLLDIGCGCGGLALYAAGEYKVSVLGVTLSKKQAQYAAEQIAKSGMVWHVEIRLQDYRDLQKESFDKIVSVGMFEHVGRDHLPEYFSQAYRLLKPRGLFLNHGISSQAPVRYSTVPETIQGENSVLMKWIGQRVMGINQFMQRYVFPDGELVPVSEANIIAEASRFEVRDVENLREHYALTLRDWVKRLEANRAEGDPAGGRRHLPGLAVVYVSLRVGV